MTPTKHRRSPLVIASIGIQAVFGIACVVAGLIGDQAIGGLVSGLLFGAGATLMLFAKGTETAQIVAFGDVRERQIDTIATAITGVALLIALGGWLVFELATDGRPWLPGMFLALGGITYLVAVEALRRTT